MSLISSDANASNSGKLERFSVIGTYFKRVYAQIKRLIDNVKAIAEIIDRCGIFSLAVLPIYFLAMWVTFQISMVISGGLVAIGTALCGPICGFFAVLFVAPLILNLANTILELTKEGIFGSSRICPG